jgi:tetratricopeptide (TPR) repeat protein
MPARQRYGCIAAYVLAFGFFSSSVLADISGDFKECIKSEDPDKVIQACTSFLQSETARDSRLQDSRSRAHFNRASSRFKKADYKGAIADFSVSIKADPKSADSYAGRAYALFRMDSSPSTLESALSDFNTAIRLDSKRADFYVGRGIVLRLLENLDLALADLNHAISLQYDGWDIYYQRALVYMLQATAAKDDAQSTELFQTAIQDCDKATSLGMQKDNECAKLKKVSSR